jgi:hypothetical protein
MQFGLQLVCAFIFQSVNLLWVAWIHAFEVGGLGSEMSFSRNSHSEASNDISRFIPDTMVNLYWSPLLVLQDLLPRRRPSRVPLPTRAAFIRAPGTRLLAMFLA